MVEWLMSPEVMRALGFYGGGAATVIGSLWVIYKHFTAKSAPPAKPEPTIQAHQGIAAGGNITLKGDMTVSNVPRKAWVVLALGIAGLTAASLFGGDTTTITNGVQVGGDMQDSDISIEK